MFLFSEEPTLEVLDFALHIGSTSNFLIFRFVSEHCLRSIQRLFQNQSSFKRWSLIAMDSRNLKLTWSRFYNT